MRTTRPRYSSWRPEPAADLPSHGRGHSDRRGHLAGGIDSGRSLFLIGFLGGTFGGLLGIGGGSVIAPLLLLTAVLRPAQVAGTTLTVVLVISAAGTGVYAFLGHLNLLLALPIAIGSVAGSVVGALWARHLSARLMVVIFLVVLPYFAIKEFWPSVAAPVIAADTVSLGLLGFAAGIFSGLLGISGASLVVPSLVAFFLVDHHTAQGTAIAVALVDSIAGAATHASARNIHYRTVFFMAGPALAAAFVGALFSDWLPAPVLRNVFGFFMVAVWSVMVLRLIAGPVSRRVTLFHQRHVAVSGPGDRR